MIELLVVVVVAVVVVFALQRLVVRFKADTGKAEHVLRSGQPATAVILDTYDTGERIDTMYVLVRMRLLVEASPEWSAFESDIVVPVSPVKLSDFSVGKRAKVRVIAASRDIAIDQPLR
ncbi:hypothetical protein J2W25_006509 [Variovorax boronicumulans]|uniref:DUF3592 domain-containing protein n=1 Tax=Variovorax boronicumulans TaxID=436515 RepID=A0AAW8E799_9BURK|nr:hypothetical protein [Variovorax boronicumulans]MDP9882216.1 hypothetical protein [Variovorax boronicumulans]MDP9920293.1 hypothetical protein [Variovorax boronicumulans]MDP9927455.1 hypothetical protein [Variovorax boronicumulans]